MIITEEDLEGRRGIRPKFYCGLSGKLQRGGGGAAGMAQFGFKFMPWGRRQEGVEVRYDQ